MPISKNEFEKAKLIKTFKQEVLDFLKTNSTSAYTVGEIVKEVTKGAVAAPFAADYVFVVIALVELMGHKEVLCKIVGKDVYFTKA